MKYTILVNKQNPFKENFLKKINLIETKDINDEITYVEEKTYEQYLKLKEFLLEKNLTIGIDSSYRSLENQQEIYDRFIEIYGKDYADQVVAKVGTSEHHTGLAIDIGIFYKDHFLEDNIELMEHEDIYREMHKYLHKFGFILRYQKGKEEITGYPYEPWHIRYVGITPATIMYENNLTLEEYLQDFGTVLYINKPKDITSFDVVNEVSKTFGIKRVGHTGTLDPLATGVMLVAVGKATKIVELLTAEDKEYIAGVTLGIKTDTYDIEGTILGKKEVPKDINIKETISTFKKTYLQEVPIYSAIKVNGKKLYDYARNNEYVELPKKEVTIKEIELLEENNNTFTFKTLVTKGCYIRSLIQDIGKSLNTLATMNSLIRTKQGLITIEETNSLEEIKNNKITLHKIEDVLNYDVIIVDDSLEFKIKNGVKIKDNWNIKDKVIFKNKENRLLGIYEKEDEQLRVWKNFV